jgi:phosphate starvation-inducible protein PhoH and related proteins
MAQRRKFTQSQNTEEPKKTRKEIICEIIKKKSKEKFLTENQKLYYEILSQNQITICSGPAGVGKSYIAMKAALDILADPNSPYEKIIIVRPAVEAEEKLGSLPGNVEEKLDPYIFPSYYLMNKIIGKEAREKLKEIDVIEVFALAYMRGMNIDNSILIFEEAQNSTPNQMKLLLTRIGFNSKFFISGDLEQTDRYKDKTHSGLYDAIKKFKDLKDVGVFEFDTKDVVRNPLIGKILKKIRRIMRVAIDINGVLRDTIGKFKQLYEKHLIDTPQSEYINTTYTIDLSGNTEVQTLPEPFEYKILSPVTSLDLKKHFSFQNEEEYYSFMYEEYCMELFGHSPSTEMSTFYDLNDVYYNLRKRFDFLLISDEIGKSKPATLFFLSKFGCELEKILFYSNTTINYLWDEFDILLTANPNLLLNHPIDKKVIKFETEYNKDINKYDSIKSLKELEQLLKQLIKC